VRPLAGVISVAPEILQSGNFGHIGGGKAADGRDEKLCHEYFALLGAHAPAVRRLIVVRGRHTAVELNVVLQVELVGDEVQISQDLSLAGIALGPFPFLH